MSRQLDLDRLIRDRTRARKHEWIAFRRRLHRNPEVGWQEFFTTDLIVDTLLSFGLQPRFGRDLHVASERLGVPDESALSAALEAARCGGVAETRLESMAGGFTGAVCDIEGAKPGPRRMFRFDIDALPIQECEDLRHGPARDGFRSEIKNTMHACGHDAHTAIGLGLAQMLADFREHLSGSVRLVFQPAEEGVRGAASMIACGLAENIDEFYGLHVGVRLTKLGHLTCGWHGLLATTKWDVDITGASAHAGINPEDGADALLTAAQIALSLAGLRARAPDDVRVHVGVLHAGEARNAVAQKAKMLLEVRSPSSETLERLDAKVRDVLDAAGRLYGTEVSARIVGRASAARSDSELAQKAAHAAKTMSDWSRVQVEQQGYPASDDAATWMNRVRSQGGAATFLGLGTPVHGGHHNKSFDLDESVIPSGVELLTRVVLLDLPPTSVNQEEETC